jgi:hypothetical protein
VVPCRPARLSLMMRERRAAQHRLVNEADPDGSQTLQAQRAAELESGLGVTMPGLHRASRRRHPGDVDANQHGGQWPSSSATLARSAAAALDRFVGR